MTDTSAEDITLETPYDWVRRGEERAERQWAAAHSVEPIEPAKADAVTRHWWGGVLSAVLVMILATLFHGGAHTDRRSTSHAGAQPAILTNPAPTQTTVLTSPAAKVTLTGCSDARVSGTLTNTSDLSQLYRVSVFVDADRRGELVQVPRLVGLSPGTTVTWTSSLPSEPTGPVVCSLFGVTSKPNAETTPYSERVYRPRSG